MGRVDTRIGGSWGPLFAYDRQPGIARSIAALGGLAMIYGAIRPWRVAFGLDGVAHYTYGIERIPGWAVLVMGAITLLILWKPRFLPAAIFTGLIGGGLAGLEVINVINFPVVADGLVQLEGGPVLALGGAALAGAGGIVALSVAAAVHARRGP